MERALVVFHAGYAETRRAADEIAQGLAEADRCRVVVTSPGELSAAKLAAAGIVVLGVPGSARAAQEEFEALAGEMQGGVLERKTVSLFDVGPAGHHGAGARRLRAILQDRDPSLHLAAPGISVSSVRGRAELPEPEANRCRRFGEHLVELALARGRG